MASSPLSESYEKVVLVLGILIAGALGYFAWSKSGKLQAEFVPPTAPPKKAPAIPGKPKMDRAGNSLTHPIAWEPGAIEGGREVDAFVGIPWFVKPDESTVDLGDPSEEPVHEGIPNSKWLEYGINPGYADSPDQDEDGDGFSNGEEFAAKTNPVLASSYPALIDKLVVAKLINEEFLLDFSGNTGDAYQLKMETIIGGQRLFGKMKEYIPAGDTDASIFFKSKPPGQFRFRLKEVLTEKIPLGTTGAMKNETFAIVEDLKPNLKAAGRVYKIPYSGRGKIFSDYKVVFYLNAIGEEGNEFEVPENTRFGLPYKEGATDKPFLFKGISAANEVVIEWEEGGETKVLNLPVPK